jgi:hypothetical protein
VDYRPKTNAALLRDMDQQYYGTKRRLWKGRIGPGKETKIFNEIDVLTAQN